MHDVYMDYNATAPVRPEALAVFRRACEECDGNASSAHYAGRRARRTLDEAREALAAALGVRPSEVVFTAGGTEGNNLALKGVADARARAGGGAAGHVVTSAVEHPSVLEACRWLEGRGIDVTRVPVDGRGTVDPNALRDAIRGDTFLVSVMWVNNETGVVQPVGELAALARERGILFHADAVQAFGRVAVDLRQVPADLVTISGHKFGAPKGVGALVVRRGVDLEPVAHGGGQERNRRSGTHDVPSIAALAEAARLAVAEREAETARLGSLRDALEEGVLARVAGASVNGAGARRVANTSNLRLDGADGEAVLVGLDERRIAASSASACAASHSEPSHVLMAMGLTRRQAEDSVRISLGRDSRPEDVDRLLAVLPGVVEHVRAARPAA